MATKTNYSSRWARLAPIVFITYSLAYVDRANYSIGSAGGLVSDLGISGQAGALLGALFFLGYFLFQVPAAWYAETRSAKRLMF
jgi:sugar phosphate permease